MDQVERVGVATQGYFTDEFRAVIDWKGFDALPSSLFISL
jgi:hypothetical protein